MRSLGNIKKGGRSARIETEARLSGRGSPSRSLAVSRDGRSEIQLDFISAIDARERVRARARVRHSFRIRRKLSRGIGLSGYQIPICVARELQ